MNAINEWNNAPVMTIYAVILLYFLSGGIAFYLINRKKPREVARQSYTKFATYFLIIHILFFSIVFWPISFTWIAGGIIFVGYVELIRVFIQNGGGKKKVFILSVFLFSLLSVGFFGFSRLDRGLILLSFLILSIFDSFSQISGQLFGRKKLLPRISPNKTIGGLAGGTGIAILSGYLLRGLYPVEGWRLGILILGIVLFAFGGDVAASWYKRTYSVKDFSKWIPGHGGFLDRFDSLIAGGCWVMIWVLMI